MTKEIKKNTLNQKTTGHEWDGIEEYDNPDPFWLRILFYCMLFFAIVYWLFYPSWPSPHSFGILNWSSDQELKKDLEQVKVLRSKYQDKFDKSSFQEILDDKQLLKFALSGGSFSFQNNCSVCHGQDALGATGYPNLRAGAWMWGGKIEDIYQTLKYGIRSTHEETRESAMAAFGKDKILSKEQITSLTNYILNLNNSDYQDSGAKKLYAEHCASCHGNNAEGSQDQGAPNLRDAIWLYGSDFSSIYNVIFNGKAGVMPYWEKKLDDSTIRQLAIYVHQLGGGK